VKWTLARALAAGAALLAVSAGGMAGGAVSAGGAAGTAAIAERAGTSHHVVLIGIPGLRWSDMSAAATPALWRLATAGSVGSVVVITVYTRTCPVDAWLTLNSGASAAARRAPSAHCPALPAVVPKPGPGTARVPVMPRLIAGNRQFSYDPEWGVLACPGPYLTRLTRCSSPAGPGQCSTAIGPGAAIALANSRGEVASYLPRAGAAGRSDFDRCALTVADLGALPAARGASGSVARARAVHAADLAAGRISTEVPAGTIIMVAGLGDDTAPHLRALMVSGPGFRNGLLGAPSTRQPGMTVITDLTSSVRGWLGRPTPDGVVGSQISSTRRGPLTAAVRALIGQDTAAQVNRSTIGRFFVVYVLSDGVLLALITLMLAGSGNERRRRRSAAYMAAGVLAGAVPAGTFLASLVPWPQLPHPAFLLYVLTLAWTAVIAAAALAGPWRRDPFGPPGFVGTVTVAVIGLDVMTGSRLQLGGPFGLSALEAGRFYGVGNHALGVYGAAGILCSAWAGIAALRSGSRGPAVAAAAAAALFTVIASGWPGFGAKVGGTIAMVPAFLVLLAAIAGLRITARRGVIIAISGVLLVTAFALVNYLLPATGTSDIGGFVGHALHGGAGPILRRKISSNIGSLTRTWYRPAVPAVAAVTGLMIAWPARLRLTALAGLFGRARMLRPPLAAIWLLEVLGWLADDSGVIVAAIALPFVLPLAIAMVSGVATGGSGEMPEHAARASSAPAPGRAG
jgi:hypothetical protein